MRKWYGITLHHSASPQSTTVETIRAWHKKRGWKDIGYHFVIEVHNGRGYLKAGRSTKLAGAHSGVAYYNRTTLGVCVVGNYNTQTMSEELYKDVINALKHIISKFNISPVKIYGHKDIKPTDCPGRNFPLERIKKELMGNDKTH